MNHVEFNKSRLRGFKSKYMVKLMELRRKLLEKYQHTEQVERINYIIDMLMNKLKNLRTYTLADYLHTVYKLCRQMDEFCELIPESNELPEEGGEN